MDILEKLTWAPHPGGYEIVEKVPSPKRARGVRAVDPKTGEKTIGYEPTGASSGEGFWAAPAEPTLVPALRLPMSPDGPLPLRKAVLRKLVGVATPYRPLDREHSALFQDFAATPPTGEGIVGFANRFGMLGLDRSAVSFDPRRHSADRFEEEEPLSAWKLQIRHMQSAIRRWRGMAGTTDEKAIRGLLDVINVELQDRVAQRLSWDPSKSLFEIGPLPFSLIGALWLQFAFAVSRKTEYRACRQCQKPFEVATGRDTGKRSDAVFCSPACKSADRRRRIETATRMKSEGRTLGEIAAAVERPITRVRAWINKKTRT